MQLWSSYQNAEQYFFECHLYTNQSNSLFNNLHRLRINDANVAVLTAGSQIIFAFITLFSLSSGGRGGPSPCMPYKVQLWYFDGYLVRLLTSFVHLLCILKAIKRQVYTTMKVPFSLPFNFLMDSVLDDSILVMIWKSLKITILNSAKYFRLMYVFACWVRCVNWHPPACVLEETLYKIQSKKYCIYPLHPDR